MKIRTLLFASASLFASLGATKATSLGFDADPLGVRDGASIGYAFWDAFSASSFAYTSPGASSGSGVFAGAMKSDASGGIVTGAGDRLYQNSNPFSFTINGGTGTGANAAVVQLKFTSPSSGDPLAFFDLTLNSGIAPTSVSLFGTSTEDSNTFNIVTYSWEGLSLPSGGQVKFTISSAAEHVSLDGVTVDVAAVPEPAAWLMLAIGLGVLVLVNRRGRILGAISR